MERDVFVFNDGAIGTFWELCPISHELLSENELNSVLSTFCKIFESSVDDQVTLQVLFYSYPSKKFELPENDDGIKNFARIAQNERIKTIQSLAQSDEIRKLVRRRVFLTLRVDPKITIQTSQVTSSSIEDKIKEQLVFLEKSLVKLRQISSTIEYVVQDRAKIELSRSFEKDLIEILKFELNCLDVDAEYLAKEEDNNRKIKNISKKVVQSNFKWEPDAVEVGGDTIEAISWIDQPTNFYTGLMAELLNNISAPIKAVLNIRPNNNGHGIEDLINATKTHGDSLKERQNIEAKRVEKRQLYGEVYCATSLHVFMRNPKVKISENKELRGGRELSIKLKNATSIPFILEEFAAYEIFQSCLPFAYSKKVSSAVGREFRVLSEDLKYYLPIFGGSRGEIIPYQLMQNRGGEALWFNPRVYDESPHYAILASSGGGKSFFESNMLTSEIAYEPSSKIFIIDNITSYEIWAKTMGEDVGCEIIKPPSKFPNIFKGVINSERLPIIVSVIKTAVNLVSNEVISGSEEVLLGDAILKTYNDNITFSKKKFVYGEDGELGYFRDSESGRYKTPRLSGIIDNFNTVCGQKGFDEGLGLSLKTKLMPLFGSGPYSILFDSIDTQLVDEPNPGIFLADLEGIQGDDKLMAMTCLMIVCEILRQMQRPENKGRPGQLVIDESGVVLNGNSKELEKFVETKWPTLRKKDVVCGCLTNLVEHYTKIPACKVMFQISPNKIVLPMSESQIREAQENKLLGDNNLIYELIRSLEKRDGVFSEGLWISKRVVSSFTYVPTGFDYWLAVSKDTEKQTIERLKNKFGTYQKTIYFLATHKDWEFGLRNPKTNKERPITENELEEINSETLD